MAEISKTKLVELSDAKLSDAKVLFAADRFGNAYYLAGYAVELMLKAILAGQFKANTIPDKALLNNVFIHNLGRLLEHCQLTRDLKEREDSDADFGAYWQVVKGWTEASRYEEMNREAAAEFIEAIENSEHGVGPWLRSKL